MKYTIYQITNVVNGKVYVGKHKTDNLDDGYMGSGKLIKRAIAKHGLGNFRKEMLFIFDSEEQMNQKEAELVTEEFCLREDTYNLCVGGHGGFSYINRECDLVERNRKVQQNRDYSDEGYIQNLKNSAMPTAITKLWQSGCYDGVNFKRFEGKKHSEETKRKIGKQNKLSARGSNNGQFGTCWINNRLLKESKRIKLSELDGYLKEGWVKGRKMKF